MHINTFLILRLALELNHMHIRVKLDFFYLISKNNE